MYLNLSVLIRQYIFCTYCLCSNKFLRLQFCSQDVEKIRHLHSVEARKPCHTRALRPTPAQLWILSQKASCPVFSSPFGLWWKWMPNIISLRQLVGKRSQFHQTQPKKPLLHFNNMHDEFILQILVEHWLEFAYTVWYESQASSSFWLVLSEEYCTLRLHVLSAFLCFGLHSKPVT